MSDRQFLARQIQQWKQSPQRQMQIVGVKYAHGEHDILHHQRTAIGKGGKLTIVHNLPNARIVDNQYARMVAQKTDYLLGKPPTFDSENKQYTAALQTVFGAAFLRQLRLLGQDALNGGIGWLMPYYDEQGSLAFRRFEPYQILPFWQDAEHTVLDAAIYLYEVEAYEGETEKIVEHVEAFTPDGIDYFVYDSGALTPEEPWHTPYVTLGAQALNWSQIPLIPWKANAAEIPLIRRVKPLQDAINLMESAFENGMLEDPRNTILVVVNYDGTEPGELRQNLATYGVLKVRNGKDEPGGDVRSLNIELNSENYQIILKLFKQALIENARGYDAKDDRLSGNPNQMNIQSMYSDIDLDANAMETEFQASFEQLLWFVNAHLANSGVGNFDGIPVKITFARNVLINQSDIIQQCKDSVGIVSDRTILAHHPFVDDVDKELEHLKEQKQEDMQLYGGGTFPQHDGSGGQPQVSADEEQ
ncbi:phage portal protein [Caproicibacterium sp. XB1]|uniref:phage portal protein n=1 Tax=Caproicibacterium sp. XB1 TaxID=3396405 RepID=UPI0039B6FD7C